MREFFRAGLAFALAVVPAASSLAQVTAPATKPQTPATKPQTPATKGQPPAATTKGQPPATTTKGQPPAATTKGVAQPAPPVMPALPPDEPVAFVNGQKIMKLEVLGYLSQFPIPPGEEQQAYQVAVTLLTNTELLSQFLKTQKLDIPAKEIDEQVAKIEKELKETQNTSLQQALKETNTSIDEIKERITQSLRWKKYVTVKATDAELKKFFETNKDSFDKTRVRASHILLTVKPDASAADKETVKQRLLAIRKEIESGKISFKDAANKYSEDPGNQETKAGGDLDYFPRKGMFVEPFAAAAFGLKVNQMSNPVETEYGWHLIQTTDRKQGEMPSFDQIKDQILQQYAIEMQNQIVADARKTAKIEVKPMPRDLFPAPPPGLPAAPATGAAAAKGATAPATTKGAVAPATKAAGTPKPGTSR